MPSRLLARASSLLPGGPRLKRLGAVAVVLFTLKGLAWLGVAAAAVYWAR